jgi:hypothetical protein
MSRQKQLQSFPPLDMPGMRLRSRQQTPTNAAVGNRSVRETDAPTNTTRNAQVAPEQTRDGFI